MSTRWTSTDRFRRPRARPRVEPEAQRSFLWILCIAALGIGLYAGNKFYRPGKLFGACLGRYLPGAVLSSSQRNYADITMGAEVVLAFTTRSHITEKDSLLPSFYNNGPQRRAAELVFKTRHEDDGRCWEIDGGIGTIAIRLSESIIPTAIAVHQSIQHQLSSRAISAPRTLAVWAVQEEILDESTGRSIVDFLTTGSTVPKDLKGKQAVKLLDFEFVQAAGVATQMFPIATSHRTDLIIVEVQENWGGKRTCIQRITIY
ncbi:hypothetical protein C8F04DRAFT_1268112 [Mycena alexandri]|uniref:SUN domain-containing protein n=1 Tax=Mycena alexandri TaxID=1745969 RepID=A0AAD6WZA2_9AGAR|nr:hypothetical protein C8F04DRAFT_1268112 [Mycena alexandri]